MSQPIHVKTQIKINHFRIAFMVIFFFAFLYGILWILQRLDNTVLLNVTRVLVGFVFVFLAASPYEWMVHRYVYHRVVIPFLKPIYKVHHLSHHYVYFPTWRYVTSGAAKRIDLFSETNTEVHDTKWGNAFIFSMHYAFYFVLAILLIMIPSWLLIQDSLVLYGQIAGSLVVSNLFITVHDSIHRPGTNPIMESQFWFKFLDRHHYIHHVDTEANVNFLLPLSDWMFGTLRLKLTDEELKEHGTLEKAKAVKIGSGEAAHIALKQL